MEIINDRKLRIIGPLILFGIGTVFFRLNWYFELTPVNLIRSDLIAIAAGYFCWNLARWVVMQLQQRYPGLGNTRRRLIWMVLLTPLLVNIAWFVRQLAHVVVNPATKAWTNLPDYTYALGIQIFFHCIYFVIYEGSYVMRAWRQTYEQNEQLKKNKLKHQLDTLKSQINPHFLFNSLNSLSMLIHDNPRQAEDFVDEISSVYRYLLRANEQELTTINRELQFIKSYFQLLKTRYGSGIDLHIAVSDWQLDRKIPPLTLQLLVENAVKHNMILPDSPLLIAIRTEGEMLVVQNNVQRKNSAVVSNKVGLANIATKYRLLGHSDVSIREEGGLFIVALPVLSGQPDPSPTL